MQTLDYSSLDGGTPKTVSLNRASARYLRGGDTRVVVVVGRSPTAEGLAANGGISALPDNVNYLTTEGRDEVTGFFRFVLPETDVPAPEAVAIADAGALTAYLKQRLHALLQSPRS